MRLLLVEDDATIAVPLAENLRRRGYDVECVSTGAAALRAAPADLVLLDLGLPDMEGTDVCRRLRATSDVPIIMLTARSDEMDRVLGLELGADDYVVKPFGFHELVARIRAVHRRHQPDVQVPQVEEHGSLRLDRRARRVFLADREVGLTPKEFDLLGVLLEEPGAVVPRRRILERVWETSWFGPSRTLDVHVASLRRKLGDPAWVETVRTVGFRLGEPR